MSNAKTIANDIIAQIDALEWPVPYSIQYRRMYINALENVPAAGTPESKMKITIAPVDYASERIAWGAARATCSLGIVCEKLVKDPTDDAEIDPLETFVESLSTFFVGPRHFALHWNAKEPRAIFGDDYIDELYGNSRFFVPILIDFFSDGGVS